MSLIFYGKHHDWTNYLNDKLIPYLDNINSIKNVDKIDGLNGNYIIPLMEVHMIELYKNNINAIMPKLNIIETFMCKKMFNDYVIANNLICYVPKTFNNATSGHVIVKPYNLNAGVGMYITNNITDLICQTYIVQEYIYDKNEYTAHIVALNGHIKCCIVYEFTFEQNEFIKGQHMYSNQSKINLDKKYIDILELFLLPCCYTGVCNIDFKIISDNIKIFEINPRLGGTLMFKHNETDLHNILNNLLNLK